MLIIDETGKNKKPTPSALFPFLDLREISIFSEPFND